MRSLFLTKLNSFRKQMWCAAAVNDSNSTKIDRNQIADLMISESSYLCIGCVCVWYITSNVHCYDVLEISISVYSFQVLCILIQSILYSVHAYTHILGNTHQFYFLCRKKRIITLSIHTSRVSSTIYSSILIHTLILRRFKRYVGMLFVIHALWAMAVDTVHIPKIIYFHAADTFTF